MTGRKIVSPPPQGVDEAVGYQIECTPAAVGSIVVSVFDETDASTDVTATVMPSGTASISGGNITLPLLTNLEARHVYRIEVQYSDGANTWEPYVLIQAER